MKNLLKLQLCLATLVMTACVTINVYFPAGAAERAADQIIDSVIKGAGTAPSSPPAPASPAPPSSATPPTSAMPTAPATTRDLAVLATETGPLRRVAARLLDLLIPAAHAQANLDVSSAEIRAITASMQSRFAKLERFFDAGVVGLTADGLIDVRDIALASLPDRALVKRLVAEDNSDRDALYGAIARENGHPEWEADIRRIFAQRWVERGAKPGWYFRDLEGNWKQR
ncbi:MAG: DUF1318 domain-containing protein [Gammaproteobacteria bacterium]|nr:DUF1318 domain-containing protein [Gammaproteobacteria bacterium]